MNRALLSFIAIAFLLATASFAQEDQNNQGGLTQEQRQDLMGGFLDGLGTDSDITDEGLAEADNLVKAINLLEEENHMFAVKGLKMIGALMDKLPSIIDNVVGVDGADDYFLNEMETIAKDLQNIDAYESGPNSNDLIVRNVSILALVNEAEDALNAGNYYESGWAIGDALSDIYTATTPPGRQEVLDDAIAKAQEWTPGPVPESLQGFKSLDEFSKAKLGIPEEVMRDIAKERRRIRRLRKSGWTYVSKIRKEDLPENFDARQKWPNCVFANRNQGSCGSCWAFAGTSAFADRVCIASGGKIKKVLSPQHMVNCGPEPAMSGCDGGDPRSEFKFFETNGVWQDSCLSYTSGESQRAGECSNTCHDGSTPNVIYAKQGSTVSFKAYQVEDIKHELMTNGPMTTCFDAYDDIMNYKSGIYSHTTGGNPGGHAVKLIGWGKDPNTGTEYWLCANSWGNDWGDNGFFKIKAGDSDINGQVAGAILDIQRSVVSNNNGADIPVEDASGNTGGGELWGPKDGDNTGGSGEQNPVDGGSDNGDESWNGDNNSSWDNNNGSYDGNNNSWNGDDNFGNDSWGSNDSNGNYGDYSWDDNNGSYDGNGNSWGNDSWNTDGNSNMNYNSYGGDNNTGSDSWDSNNGTESWDQDGNQNQDWSRKGLRGSERNEANQRKEVTQRRRRTSSSVQRKARVQRRRRVAQRKTMRRHH